VVRESSFKPIHLFPDGSKGLEPIRGAGA
jgi:hypothetical protein